MRRLSLVGLLLSAVAWAGAGKHVAVHKGAASTVRLPALSILPNGPVAPQLAAGVLTTQSGVSVTDSRDSSVYCADASGVLHLLGNNSPCVESKGLRAEGSATNVFLQSNTFNVAAWQASAPNIVLTANAATSPDGTNDAWSLADNSTSGNHWFAQNVTWTAAGYAFSVYAKAGTSNCLNLYADSSSQGAAYNLSTGTVVGTFGSPAAASMAAVPGFPGWYRLLLAFTGTAAANNAYIMANAQCLNTGVPSYAGTGSTVFLAFAQAELGIFATSYTPTTTTSATRAAEQPTVPGVASGHTPSFSTDFTPVLAANGTQFLMQLENSGSDRWDMFLNGSGALGCDYFNGAGFTTTTSNVATSGTVNHARCYYDGTHLVACLNGQCASTTQSFTSTATTYTAAFGRDVADNGTPLFGWVASNGCVDSAWGRCQ